jgi:hypothetical protein
MVAIRGDSCVGGGQPGANGSQLANAIQWQDGSQANYAANGAQCINMIASYGTGIGPDIINGLQGVPLTIIYTNQSDSTANPGSASHQPQVIYWNDAQAASTPCAAMETPCVALLHELQNALDNWQNGETLPDTCASASAVLAANWLLQKLGQPPRCCYVCPGDLAGCNITQPGQNCDCSTAEANGTYACSTMFVNAAYDAEHLISNDLQATSLTQDSQQEAAIAADLAKIHDCMGDCGYSLSNAHEDAQQAYQDYSSNDVTDGNKIDSVGMKEILAATQCICEYCARVAADPGAQCPCGPASSG